MINYSSFQFEWLKLTFNAIFGISPDFGLEWRILAFRWALRHAYTRGRKAGEDFRPQAEARDVILAPCVCVRAAAGRKTFFYNDSCFLFSFILLFILLCASRVQFLNKNQTKLRTKIFRSSLYLADLLCVTKMFCVQFGVHSAYNWRTKFLCVYICGKEKRPRSAVSAWFCRFVRYTAFS